jgi:hypothetical protein
VSDRFVYAQCGLRIRSEVELHLPLADGEGWDVDVVWGPDIDNSAEPPPGDVVAFSGAEDDRWYTATSTGSGYHLRFRDCGEFLISADLSNVQVRRDPAGRAELLPVLMAGTASALLLALRGETVLHASAVAINGVGLAFVRQSGGGKTTLAALMCVDGAELVTDDVLTVAADQTVTCTGGASELRLRAAAAPMVESRSDLATRSTADERLAFAPSRALIDPLPLAAIVIPSPSRTVDDIAIRRLPPSKALFALLSSPRVHGWRRPDVLSRDFSTLSQVVNTVPVYEATIPWGPPFDPSIARTLSSLVTQPTELAPESVLRIDGSQLAAT